MSKSSKNKAVHNVDADVQKMQDKEFLAECQFNYKLALREIASLKKDLLLSKAVVGWNVSPEKLEPLVFKKDKEAMPILLVGDWHADELVLPGNINDLNSYNIKIAEERSKRLFQSAMLITNMYRRESSIPRIVVSLLGDFISGWIHDDLQIASQMVPTEAVLKVLEMLISGINFLADEGKFKEIVVVCSSGNHGRITKKKHFKRSAVKSYEWLLYSFLAKHYAMDHKRNVKFKLSEGYFNWLNVFGMDLRFHHGDMIKYNGGVGGMQIPLKKAIAQWNQARTASLDLMGHWHNSMDSRNYIVNGSLIGYNEYAEGIKADYDEPKQTIFLLHPEYGKTGVFNLRVDKMGL
jgi:hypothetical protein